MAILQVRNMDDKLYEKLRRRAASENRSISQQAVEIIQRGLDTEPESFGWRDDAVLALVADANWEENRREAEAMIREIYRNRKNQRQRRLPELV